MATTTILSTEASTDAITILTSAPTMETTGVTTPSHITSTDIPTTSWEVSTVVTVPTRV